MSHDFALRVAGENAVTGSYLVFFEHDCCDAEACDLVEKVLHRRPARSSEFNHRIAGFAQELHANGAAYFDEFHFAILDPAKAGMDPSSINSMLNMRGVAGLRPEYRLYASGWLARLFGFETSSDDVDRATEEELFKTLKSNEAAKAGEATWGVNAVGALESGYTGKGVKVAVLDTGMDFKHPDFEGREIISESFVSGETAQDGAGHGTHVAGTVAGPATPKGVARYGVAPDASLYVGKVLGDNGMGREGDMLAGILWALENGCDIISMSLGRRPLPGDNAGDFDKIGRTAFEKGALIIAAAGNESARKSGRIEPVATPAAARSIMAVGAIDEKLQVADFSNGGLNEDGGGLDIAGPGVNVLSSIPGGGHGAYAGTSMATPHVSGVAALWAESDPTLRGEKLWKKLTETSKNIGGEPRDVGAGLTQSPKKPPTGVV
ncbi:MAG: S8 family serine peptidase [Neomegalonema sp.]|nr:S8 family serine peptidase [Neomegalonema sp.]